MLKRNDLAKQFELVVQQEIINHNDSISATNESLNQLRESLKQNAAKNEQVLNKISSDLGYLNIEIYNLKSSISRVEENFNSALNDQRSFNEKIPMELKNLFEYFEKEDDLLKCIFAEFENVWLSVVSLEDDVKKNEGELSGISERLLNIFRKEILDSKNEILSSPSEASQVKKELEEKMAIDRVDFQGVIRELAVHKKTVFIAEKNIENLYTQIERLKVGKS